MILIIIGLILGFFFSQHEQDLQRMLLMQIITQHNSDNLTFESFGTFLRSLLLVLAL